jgi:TolB protein
MKKTNKIAPVLLCAWASAALAQDSVITIGKQAAKAIPVSIRGFSGEAEAVLKFDLGVLGMKLVDPGSAEYLVGGAENGRLEGRLARAGTGGAEIFARAYSSGGVRSEAHSFADDIAKEILGTPSIFHSRIAFCRNSDGVTEVCVSDFDGHNLTQMSHDGNLVATPSWAPGGRELFYTSWQSGRTEILEHDVATGARRAFTGYGGASFKPVVSPNGGRVAMILSKDGNPNLYVREVAEGKLLQLTHGRDEVSSPTWSPNGREICCAIRHGRATLWKISAAGGAPTAMRVGGPAIYGDLTSPDWSPDGRQIIFTCGSGEFSLCVAPAEGGDAEKLVAGEDPCWAPNSRTVVFMRRVNFNKVLSLLDVPTKTVKDVGQLSGSCSQPAWER